MGEVRSILGLRQQAPNRSNNRFVLMPKMKRTESQKEQIARFRAEVERLIAAGGLRSTEADERFEALLSNLPE